MKKCWLVFWCCAALAAMMSAGAADAPPRLAILVESPALATVADLLTAAFSNEPGVVLLERAEIGRILEEQKLSLGGLTTKDFLKVGQLLGADGLVILENPGNGQRQRLNARLIAAKPGVVLAEHQYPWPLQDAAQWGGFVRQQLKPYLPKLGVLTKDAIPISILAVRSALGTRGAKELEHELTQLLIDRLVQEPEIFVLERQHVREVIFEQELTPAQDEAEFWTGRFLLESTLDQNGFDPLKATLTGRMMLPQGGLPVVLKSSGPRNDPSALVEAITEKILAALRRAPGTNVWHPLAEADRYFAAANQAFHWGLTHETQEASESAWLLGKRTREVALLRMRGYLDDLLSDRADTDTSHFNFRGDRNFIRWYAPGDIPDAARLKPALRALELFGQNTRLVVTNSEVPDLEWFKLGLKTLDRVDRLLENYYFVAELRTGHEAELAELRSRTRDLVTILQTINPNPAGDNCGNCMTLNSLKWEDGGLWFERPEQALPMLRQAVESNLAASNVPFLVGWLPEDRKRLAVLEQELIAGMLASTNLNVRLQGLYFQILITPQDEAGAFERRQQELFAALWEHRASLGAGIYSQGQNLSPGIGNILARLDNALRARYGIQKNLFDREPFAGFRQRLRQDFLLHGNGDDDRFIVLLLAHTFGARPIEYSQADARELLPLLAGLDRRVSAKLVRQLEGRLLAAFPDGTPVLTSLTPPTATLTSSTNATSAVRQPRQQTPAEWVVQITPWKLNPSTRGPDYQLLACRPVQHRNKIWWQILDSWHGTSIRVGLADFVVVDPEAGTSESIHFPDDLVAADRNLQMSGNCYEVADDSLFVSFKDHLLRYRFRERSWNPIPLPVDFVTDMKELNGRLYLVSREAFLELDPDSGKVRILASSRRRPALNPVDELEHYTSVFGWPEGKVTLLAGLKFVSAAPATEQWDPVKLPAVNLGPSPAIRASFSRDGAVVFLGGWAVRQYLMGIWPEGAEAEALLEQGQTTELKATIVPSPVKWRWPTNQALEVSSFVGESGNLWTLSPRNVSISTSFPQGLSPAYDDNRTATLLRFEPGFREGLLVPLRLERNGQPADPFTPKSRYKSPESPFSQPYRVPTQPTVFLNTAQGLFIYSRDPSDPPGHWLIPRADLDLRLQALRQQLRQNSGLAGLGDGPAKTGTVPATNSTTRSKP